MSINPLFDPSTGRFDSRIDGVWSCSDTETWTFEQQEEKDHDQTLRYYDVLMKSVGEGRAIAVLGKIGTRDYITFTAEDVPAGQTSFIQRHYRSVFSLGRIEFGADRLTMYMLDTDWVEKKSNVVARGLGQLMFDGSVLLTAPPKSLQSFVASNATNEDAFPQTVVLVKPGATGGSCYSDH